VTSSAGLSRPRRLDTSLYERRCITKASWLDAALGGRGVRRVLECVTRRSAPKRSGSRPEGWASQQWAVGPARTRMACRGGVSPWACLAASTALYRVGLCAGCQVFSRALERWLGRGRLRAGERAGGVSRFESCGSGESRTTPRGTSTRSSTSPMTVSRGSGTVESSRSPRVVRSRTASTAATSTGWWRSSEMSAAGSRCRGCVPVAAEPGPVSGSGTYSTAARRLAKRAPVVEGPSPVRIPAPHEAGESSRCCGHRARAVYDQAGKPGNQARIRQAVAKVRASRRASGASPTLPGSGTPHQPAADVAFMRR
jgi:hypothetical protein